MEDITGLGKLAESKLVNKAYDDLLAEPAKEGGKALTDIVRALRLFAFPIQLFAAAQSRLAEFCERVRKRVPEERQIEASPSTAIPILLALRYMEDDNPLTEMYLSLLSKAIDKEGVGDVHPAFSKIIEQLSPDEAMILYQLSQNDPLLLEHPFHQILSMAGVEIGIKISGLQKDRLTYPDNTQVYAQHLESLNLAQITGSLSSEHPYPPTIGLTKFGQLFNRACIPEDFSLSV